MRRRKSSKKPLNSNQDTILLIVENSEVDFFNEYFKTYLKENYQINIKCESSGSSNKCNILNFRKMTNRVNEALDKDEYQSVFLMLDLKTNCRPSNQNHTCLIELKNEYKAEYKIKESLKNRFYLFVVCNEIESWFLTIDKNTNNIYDNHKKELMNLLKVSSEPQVVQKMIKGLKSGTYRLNFSYNSSLDYFIEKLKQTSCSNHTPR